VTPNSTFLDAMRDAAAAAGDARGFRFYDTPTDSTFASYAALERRAMADAAPTPIG
jgi:ABC-type sugar transport system substrate-binding protein